MNIKLPQPVRECIQLLNQKGHQAYIVGGCVRDSLLGNSPDDWDICTDALPEQTLECFRSYKTIPTGLQHGTITVLIQNMQLEITTFRWDGDYLDHRRPRSVTFTPSLEQDLARRDFTINAMAWHPTEGLLDPFQGQQDLQLRLVRCVGNPDHRLTEDALRILRMFRFSAKLGFWIEHSSMQAAKRQCQYLSHVSGERIQSELKKLLCSPAPGNVLQQMCQAGALQQIIPEFAPCIGFDQHTPYHNRTVDKHIFAAIDASPPISHVRLALLLHDIGKPACYHQDGDGIGHFKGHEEAGATLAKGILTRLHWDRSTMDRIVKLILLHDLEILPQPLLLKRLLSQLGPDFLRLLLEVRLADTKAKNPLASSQRLRTLEAAQTLLEEIMARHPIYQISQLSVNGRDLMQIGIPKGPILGNILKQLLELVMADESLNTSQFLLEQAAVLHRKGNFG